MSDNILKYVKEEKISNLTTEIFSILDKKKEDLINIKKHELASKLAS